MIVDSIKNIIISIFVGFLITLASLFLESSFIFDFIKTHLIMLLIALLAINTTTMSIVMTKLKEIYDIHKVDFSNTINQMKFSISEQIFLIVAGVLLQMVYASKLLCMEHVFWQMAIPSLLIGILVDAVWILRDTASSIFIIIEYENEANQ